MEAQFPSHLDPHNFNLSDFDDVYKGFFWQGFWAGKRERESMEEECAAHNQHRRKRMEVCESDSAADAPRRLPLCEDADFCVLDTETSGLSKHDCAIEIALLFFRADGNLMGMYNKLWKLPAGGRISHGSTQIHGITNTRLKQEGLDARPELSKVVHMLTRMFGRNKKVVAHNARFDDRLLRQTAKAHGYNNWPFDPDQFFCTMQAAKTFCNLTAVNGRRKAPSNSELFFHFFGKLPDVPLHQASSDCKVTARSYVEGRARGMWA